MPNPNAPKDKTPHPIKEGGVKTGPAPQPAAPEHRREDALTHEDGGARQPGRDGGMIGEG